MSIVYTADVFCDVCGGWEHGVTGRRVRARDAREHVQKKLMGPKWKRVKGQDLCPRCVSQLSVNQDGACRKKCDAPVGS
jgi:hypothetical protein